MLTLPFFVRDLGVINSSNQLSLVYQTERDTLSKNSIPMTLTPHSSSITRRTAIGSIGAGLLFPSLRLTAAEPGLPDQRASDSLFAPHELQRVTPYLRKLPAQPLSREAVGMLTQQGRLSPRDSGIVLDTKHFMFVSWDAKGLLFNKSILRSPNASHSALLALRTQVLATPNESGTPTYTAQQYTSVISFLPRTVQEIKDYVRVDLDALVNPRGTAGVNHQRLDFLFQPNLFLPNPPISVSASMLIPVSDTAYRSAVWHAFLLDHQQKPYHVLSSLSPSRQSENCITAIAGVLNLMPGAVKPLSMGPLRGQEATDYVARFILAGDGIAPNQEGYHDAPQERWALREFLAAVPSARSNIEWYAIFKN